MGRQRNRPEMKEQKKSLEKELKKMEDGNLSNTESKVMLIRMLKIMKKNIETIKNDQSEMKNTLGGINSRLGESENKISDLGDKVEKKAQSEQQK